MLRIFLRNLVPKKQSISIRLLSSAMLTVPSPSQIIQESKLSQDLMRPVDEKYFVLSEEFKVELKKKLDRKNFTSIAYRQDEYDNLIRLMQNPFQLFYLFERSHKTFNTNNFVNFIRKLGSMKRSSEISFFIPHEIRLIIAKSMVEHAPHFLAPDAFSTFSALTSLGLQINEKSIQASMQILKYHVNSYSIKELIQLKTRLELLKKESEPNKFSQALDNALSLAAQLKGGELDSVGQVVALLTCFSESISESNFSTALNFVNSQWPVLRDEQVRNIGKVLLRRKYRHFLILKKLACFLTETKENYDDYEFFFKLFNELRFYEKKASHVLVSYFLDKAKSMEEGNEERMRLGKELLEYCEKFSRKDPTLLDMVKQSNLNLEQK